MTPNNDVDKFRTAALMDSVDDSDRRPAEGSRAIVMEPQSPDRWPTQQMTATWGS